jgi:hypothetical protein
MGKIFLILSIILSITGCTSLDRITTIQITPILIAKGNLNGSEGIIQQNLVIKNNNDWDNLLTQLNNYNVSNFKETNIDFKNYQIIAVFDKVYSYGGYSIDITKITEYEVNIVVTIENLQTGGVNAVITQPFHIVKIPIKNKPIIFE